MEKKTKRAEMYSCEILESSRELTARERLKYKETSNSIKIVDLLTESTSFIFKPDGYIILGVHNEKAENDKDYRQYVLLAADGNSYITGSESLFEDYYDILEEMATLSPDEEYEVEIKALPSKNYKGKTFFKTSIV